MILVGLVGAGLLCYPFLSQFAYRAVDYGARLRLVPLGDHTPPVLGLIVLYPILAVLVLQLRWDRREPRAVWLSLVWLGLLLLSEIFYVDDVYSGKFNRFNSTLKWWPWIQAGALLTVGAINLKAKSWLCRYGTAAVLTIVSLYAIDLGWHFAVTPKSDLGRLDGAAWITSDPIEKPILEFLERQPPAIVLQRLEAGAFTPAPALVLFARQRAFLGWPEHEKLWRGQRADIALRAAEVERFYRGELPDSAQWLLQNNIDYVLWLKGESKLPPGAFEKIDAQIRISYFWREYYRAGDFRVGFWSRRRN
jgi:uncharacterized membrane protein